VIRGDLAAAVTHVTPAGGAVVTSVSQVCLAGRESGRVGFTTSLDFPKKLERTLRRCSRTLKGSCATSALLRDADREEGRDAKPLSPTIRTNHVFAIRKELQHDHSA
jgi:hypothetical protein